MLFVDGDWIVYYTSNIVAKWLGILLNVFIMP